jgi:peptide/nickel transport system permease protein
MTTALPEGTAATQAGGQARDRQGLVGIWTGATMLAAMLAGGVLVPLLSGYHPNDLVARPLQPPSSSHLFGTDQLGRDVFTRVFAAVYRDLGVAFAGVLLPLAIGTIVGVALSTLRNAVILTAINTLIEAINALPLLVLAIALIALFGPGLTSIVVILALTNWARYARIAQTRAAVVTQQGYMEAARLLGYSPARVFLRHFLPNVSSETVAYGLSDFILVIMLVAGLSFLSLGAAPPTAEWGVMMSEGRPFVQEAWWMTIFPGLALCWAGISLSFIAEGLHQREQGTV